MKILKMSFAVFLSVAVGIALFFAGVGYQVERTVLNAEFLGNEIEQVDVVGIAIDEVLAKLPEDTLPVTPALVATGRELHGWGTAQLKVILREGLAYVRSDANDLTIAIDTEVLRQSLQKNVRSHLAANPPPEIAAQPEPQRAQALRELEESVLMELAVPPVYRIELAALSPEARSDLQDVRQLVTAFRWVYWGAVATLVVAGGLLVWVGSVRWLGGVLAGFGAGLWMLLTFSQRNFAAAVMEEVFELPAAIEAHLPHFHRALMAPLHAVALISLGVGVVILVFAWGRGCSNLSASRPAQG